MATYNFYQDQKHTIWERQHFSVEAPTYEEAIEKVCLMKDLPVTENDNTSFQSCETLHDTMEMLSLEDNDGCPTLEIFNENGTEIINNAE